jgi:rhomboid family protein
MFPLWDLNPHNRFPFVTVLIIAVNVAVLATQGLGPSDDVVYNYGFIPLRVSELHTGKPVVVKTKQLNRRGDVVPGQPRVLPAEPSQVYLTFLTTMFLHGGWLHLLFNMWMLWVFGNNVEDRLGHIMFFMFYMLGGLIGTASQWMFNPMSDVPVIGASGAVATVLGGYAITYPKAMVKTLVFVGIPLILNLPALVVLGFWFVVQMAEALGLHHGLGGVSVAFWAHIGGFLAGMLLMPLMSIGAAPAGVDWKREAQELFNFDDPRVKME